MKLLDKIKEKIELRKFGIEELDSMIELNTRHRANDFMFKVAIVGVVNDIVNFILLFIIPGIEYSLFDYISIPVLLVLHITMLIILKVRGLDKKGTEIILMAILLTSAFLMSFAMFYVGCCLFLVCIVLTIQYFNIKFTIITSILGEILYALRILVYSIISFNGDKLTLLIDGVSKSNINESGDATIITLPLKNLTTFGGYTEQQYSYIFWGFTTVLIIIAILAVMSARMGGRMVIEEAETMAAKTKVELENNEAKTQIMISQIQPHFIYNTLNSIYYLCEKEPLAAQQAIGEFADYLRENLNLNSSKEIVPFSQELAHIEKYLSLEKMRFEEDLNVEYDIQCTCFKIPSLSLQPLVENAVKHGLGKKTGGGTIFISSIETYECYKVVIHDDGVGFDVDKPLSSDRVHIGLDNTKERLARMINATLNVESTIGIGSTMTIKIPKENYYEDNSR